MGDYLGGAHHLRDEKAEWCREKGLAIHRVRRDGHVLYTCLGGINNMEASQVRAELLERMHDCWGKIM
eukprot:5427282-Heterocapsa_arctica.AAC.1